MTSSTSLTKFNMPVKKGSTAIPVHSRKMANSSAVIASKCKLLIGVVQSMLRYGGSIWPKALGTNRNVKRLERTHRIMSSRVPCIYRTVSKEAVCFIAGMTLIGFFIKEVVQCFNQRGFRGVRHVITDQMCVG